MANIKSAKKRIRTNEKSRIKNSKVKSSVRTASKRVKKAMESKEIADPNAVKEMFNDFVTKIDAASRKKIIHYKTAARKKSRLAKRVNSLLKGDAGKASQESTDGQTAQA